MVGSSIKKIALLGATGSIGLSTLAVVADQSDSFEIVLATAHNKTAELLQIADKFRIPHLVITDESLRGTLTDIPTGTRIHYGETSLLQLLAEIDFDIALNAITGSAGLLSTLAILQTGKTLALANKESLVMAGHLVRDLQTKFGSSIVPVDSEHSAIFQVLASASVADVRCIHLTASGGAFRRLPLSDFAMITVEQALRHPNWDMGAKVTLDSATMFNKALEVMEAHWLFDMPYEQIRAIIHPQSIIHSLVEYVDGSFLAQMSTPDMMLPILFALSYPQRCKSDLVRTDLLQLSALTFEDIDPQRYPLFFLGVEAGKAGGIMPTVINAANEAALRLFLERKIGFSDLASRVEKTLQQASNVSAPDWETILSANAWAYQTTINS